MIYVSFLPNEVIDYKWKEGYKNINLHYELFNYIFIVDNSIYLKSPKGLLALIKNKQALYDVELYKSLLPEYSKRRFSDIYKIIIESRL